MGRKSSSKEHGASGPQAPAKSRNPLLYGAIVVAVVGVAAFALRGGSSGATKEPSEALTAPTSSPNPENSPTPAPQAASVSPQAEASARATAAFGPRKQAQLPPIPFRGYEPPRPPAVVTAAYEFAAEHPEILSYVPCFCGCERGGHRGNHDCFVRARAANGDVVEWEEHGVECAVCIDVATRSRQMHASGASVRDIRAAIEKEFVPTSPVMTPTPKPPARDH
jgi:Protein of unknown function with PCYCGC motif